MHGVEGEIGEPRGFTVTRLKVFENLVGENLRRVEALGKFRRFEHLAVIFESGRPHAPSEVTGGPANQRITAIETAIDRRVIVGAQVPLAGHVGLVARLLQQFGDARPVAAQFGGALSRRSRQLIGECRFSLDHAGTGHHHDPCALAVGRRVEVGQAHALEREPVQVRCRNLAAEGADIGEAEIVNYDQENVRPPVIVGSCAWRLQVNRGLVLRAPIAPGHGEQRGPNCSVSHSILPLSRAFVVTRSCCRAHARFCDSTIQHDTTSVRNRA